MTRNRTLSIVLALLLAVAPSLAFARAGGGFSFGSRGGRTFMAPPMTGTTPYSVAPMQRSLTPSPGYSAPTYGARPYGQGFGGSYGGRSPFVSGLMGGLIGAGIGGMLFGHGMFGGIDGFGSVFGLLIQLALLFFVGRWLLRRLFAAPRPAMAGAGLFARGAAPPGAGFGAGLGAGSAAATPRTAPVAVSPADYHAFEQLLFAVQQAWSGHDIGRLRGLATPEMVSYFAEQMAEQASRGVRNLVTDVHLDRGDLAEAWREGGRDYATVAMRFSMLDVTRDAAGRVVDGSAAERVSVAEVWTFVRASGGSWLLSAIQQAR